MAAAPVYEAQPGLSYQQRFREVLLQLESGRVGQARAELIAYLDQQPDSEVGADLLRQIDLPSGEYYPDDSREITLVNGQSLSTLAREYLGSVYQFHALAKYNGVAEPGKVRAGHTIRIPLTANAQTVFAAMDGRRKLSKDEAAAEIAATMPEPSAQEAAVEEQVLEPVVTSGTLKRNTLAVQKLPAVPAGDPDALHRKALNAYRAQDLQRAIELWDEVLVIDSGHERARLYRTQALELQSRLRRLN